MTKWVKYPDMENYGTLRFQGREVIGRYVWLTEKRDGSNISLWLKDDEPVISSRKKEQAAPDLAEAFKSTNEYEKALEGLRNEKKEYRKEYILYGELIRPGLTPTRLEPKHKKATWILFDIYDTSKRRFLSYSAVHQFAITYRLPIVRLIDVRYIKDIDAFEEMIDFSLKWAARHRREGVVAKLYEGKQLFFKIKRNLPKLQKIKEKKVNPQYPPMPVERIKRAFLHALEELNYDEEKWKDKKIAMPIIAKHVATEAREHYYNPPKNIFRYYTEWSIKDILEVGNEQE